MGGGKLQAHIPSNGPARDIPKPREGLGTAKQTHTEAADKTPRAL